MSITVSGLEKPKSHFVLFPQNMFLSPVLVFFRETEPIGGREGGRERERLRLCSYGD